MKRRFVVMLGFLCAFMVATAVPAWAGNPHFVGTPTVTRSGDDLTVSGKLAGLGNEAQVEVVVTADAQCVNRGNNEPQAENKGAVLAKGTFPVQNGKADFTLTGSAQTDPTCNPPMKLQYTNVTVTAAGLSYTSPKVY